MSGGIDSKVLLHYLIKELEIPVKRIHALCVNRGNAGEVEYATEHCREMGVELTVVTALFPWKDAEELPYRNLVFLSYLVSFLKTRAANATAVYYATHAPASYFRGYYDDCSPVFVEAFDSMSHRLGINLEAPFLYHSLKGILRLAEQLEVDLSNTLSCNHREDMNCGVCMKCRHIFRTLAAVKYERGVPWFKTTHTKSPTTESVAQLAKVREIRVYHNNLCQRDCHFCSYRRFEPSQMSDETYDRLLLLAKREGSPLLMFSGREPLYDGRGVELMARAGAVNLKCDVNTNGEGLIEQAAALKALAENHVLRRILLSDNANLRPGSEMLSTLQEIPCLHQIYLMINDCSWKERLERIQELHSMGISRFYVRFEFPTIYTPVEQEDFFDRLWELELPGVRYETPIDMSDLECASGSGLFARILEQHREFGYVLFERQDILSQHEFLVHTHCEAFTHTLTVVPDGTVYGCAKHTYGFELPGDRSPLGSIHELEDLTAACRERILHRGLDMCLPSCEGCHEAVSCSNGEA